MPDDLDPTELPQPVTVNTGGPSSASSCPSCGADLTGVAIGGACPSCGRVVGTNDGLGGGQKTNGLAVTSMVMGILSIPACFCYGIFSIIFAVLGLVFAHIAGKQMAEGGFADSSRSMNLAGKICSWIGLVLGVLYIVLLVVFFAIGMANASSGSQPGPPSFPYNPPSQPSIPQVGIQGSNGSNIISYPSGASAPSWPNSAKTSGTGSHVEVGADGRIRQALPNGLEYGPNNQVRPNAPQGLQYGPGGQLRPALPTAPMPYSPPGVPGIGNP